MSYCVKKTILSVSVTMMMMASVLGQTVPASGTLEKRDYSYLNDQHLTARFGNHMVCGDHMCAPGEWTKMQENLNQAQIGHIGKNVINTTTTTATNSPTSTTISGKNSTSSTTISGKNSTSSKTSTTPPVEPIPTPPPVPYSICNAVKEALANSTITSSIVTKIMASLGCT